MDVRLLVLPTTIRCAQGEKTLAFYYSSKSLTLIVSESKCLGSLLKRLDERFPPENTVLELDDEVGILEALGSIGWDSVEDIADDLRTATLSHEDERGVKHLLEVEFTPGGVKVSHNLPPEVSGPQGDISFLAERNLMT